MLEVLLVFLKNPLARALLIAGVAFSVGYVEAWHHYDKKEQLQQLQSQLEFEKTKSRVLIRDADQASIDSLGELDLAKQVEILRNELTEKDAVCFGADDTRRVQSLWK